MKNSYRIFILIFLFAILVAGCSNNTDLSGKIEALQTENTALKSGAEQLDSLSMAYQTYADKQRLVPKESRIYALPIQGFKILRPIEANTVVQVFDAASCQDQQLWLYVAVPVYDTPVNMKGWIPEAETVKLTKDNVGLVQGDVFLKAGTPIYEVERFAEIRQAAPVKITGDTRGRIEKRQESFAYLRSPGGWNFWVEAKYLIFPPVGP
jgi:outer membrane murein-binding lipoprotein Lpp